MKMLLFCSCKYNIIINNKKITLYEDLCFLRIVSLHFLNKTLRSCKYIILKKKNNIIRRLEFVKNVTLRVLVNIILYREVFVNIILYYQKE